MGGLYLGGKLVTPVIEKEVAKTKFGASVDTFIGDVDENGVLSKPRAETVLDFTGVKEIGAHSLTYAFYGRMIKKVIANDVTKINTHSCHHAFESVDLSELSFNSLEEADGDDCFNSACSGNFDVDVSFLKLRKILAANAFKNFASYISIVPDKSFPVLEEVSGAKAMDSFRKFKNQDTVTFSKIKKIVGQSSIYNAIFYTSVQVIFYLPNAIDITKYTFYKNSTVHFALANQAAIEACDGYSYKFGAKEIYFDLMLNITVNSVVYTRDKTIDGYTSWADESGNIVYTDATAEPAVDTPVYSDNGTTQVGTVSAVA